MPALVAASLRAQPYHPGYKTPEYEYTCSRGAPSPFALQTLVISEATLAITSPRSVRLSPVYISRVSCSGLYSFL